MPEVYIIILNWNGLDDTLECLQSLGKIDYPHYKIVLVDNKSKNDEGRIIKQQYPEIHLIQNKKNEGYAQGNNIGIEYALKQGADYILFLNNDTVVLPDFLSILVEYLQKHETVGVVGPKMLYYDSDKIWFNGGKIYWWIGFARHLERLKQNTQSKITSPLEVEYITTVCCLVKKEVFEKIGLLDSSFFIYYDDTDWCFRARRAGYKNVVVPAAVIRHKVSVASGVEGRQTISPFQAYFQARNAIIFGRKNLFGFKKFIFLSAQYTLRLAVNLILCSNNQARREYFKGLLAAHRLQ